MSNTEETLLARLKPRDPRRGHVLRCYSIAGVRLLAGHGWYRVSRAVGEHLREVRQRGEDLNSPLAFDVATVSDALEIDERERGDGGPRPAARPNEADPRHPRGGAADPRRGGTPAATAEPRKKDEPKKDG